MQISVEFSEVENAKGLVNKIKGHLYKMALPKHGIQESVKRIQYCIVWTIEFYRLLYLMLTMLYSTRSLDYRFGHRSHMLFTVTGRRVCIITWSGLSEGFQFHPEHIICSVDSFSIVSLGKMIQLQMHFGFNQSLQLDSSASNEQHNFFFTPFYNAIFTTLQWKR